MSSWPVITADDPGIRPAGPPDECFYCFRKVGEEHALDCVTVQKLVRITYTVALDVAVPHFWDEEMIRFHRTESTWCADNLEGELDRHLGDVDEHGNRTSPCLCGRLGVLRVEVLDETPRLDLDEEDEDA